MGKTIFKRLAALALTAGLCLSFAGAVKADDYYINDLGEDGYQELINNYQNRPDPYSDVSTSAWYCEAVEACKTAGYMNGYPDGTFRPNATITRAECAQILSNVNSHWDAEVYYSDVAFSAWYADVASHYGPYMGGSYTDYSQTTPLGYAVYFYPSRSCTREDFAYGFGNVIHITSQSTAANPFADQSAINPNYANTILCLRNEGIINGNPDGTFAPKSTITRAEVAQILYNYELRVWLH